MRDPDELVTRENKILAVHGCGLHLREVTNLVEALNTHAA